MPTDTADRPARSPKQKLIKLAHQRFEQWLDAGKQQREREREDIRFDAGDQWPDDVRTIRKGQNAQNGLPPVPARPCITIQKQREPVRQVLNQERQSDMGIEIVAADDFEELSGPIDPTEIELREGLVRRIQRESKAADARTWAFQRAVIAGTGYYVVMTRYAPGKTNDQEIYIHRFYDQSCVALDPAHEQPDGSDCEWEMWATDLSWDAYTSEYGERNGKKNTFCDCTDGEFAELSENQPHWFWTENDTRRMRVINYFYTVRESREIVSYANADGQQITEWTDETPEPPVGFVEVPDSRRKFIDKRIKWAKLDGCDDDVLEETDWLGPDMPIVKVIGEELQPYDTERRVQGMIRPMREPGYAYNVMVSKWVETIGLTPMTPIMLAEGAWEGYDQWYQASNTRTLPFLPYKQYDDQGRPINEPRPAAGINSPIGPIAESVALFDQAIQSTSGHPKPSLGQTDPSVKSAKQARLLQEQATQGSNHFLDNLQRSIRYEGQIINNLLYPIYGTRPGRIARIVNGAGDGESVIVGQPMLQQNGRPVPAPDSPNAKTYALTPNAKFNVIVKVSKSFDSRREQETQIIGELLSSDPALMTWFGDIFFQHQDGPGHTEMAERAKAMLAPAIQQLLASKAQGMNIPPAVQAQLAQAQQQIQALQAELQKATAPGAVEQIKQQGEQERHKMDLLFDRLKLHVDSEVKLAVAEISSKSKEQALFVQERARVGAEGAEVNRQAHEVGMAAMNAGTSADAAQRDAQNSADAAETQRAHDAEMQQSAQDAQAQQAAAAAAAKPQGA